MKHLVLTGIATELDIQSGSTSYSLIFNGGEMHLPVSEESAETAVAMMLSEDGEPQKAEPDFDWEKEEELRREEEAGAGFHIPEGSTVGYEEATDGPTDGEIAAVVAQQGWQSDNGQLPLDPQDQGAEIFSADDYAHPPDHVMANHSQVDDINDGVGSI